MEGLHWPYGMRQAASVCRAADAGGAGAGCFPASEPATAPRHMLAQEHMRAGSHAPLNSNKLVCSLAVSSASLSRMQAALSHASRHPMQAGVACKPALLSDLPRVARSGPCSS